MSILKNPITYALLGVVVASVAIMKWTGLDAPVGIACVAVCTWIVHSFDRPAGSPGN